MNTMDPEEKANHAKQLRQRAEDALRGKPVDLEGLHTDDVQYLLHELQVHQAELAIQNEELRKAQLDLEISRDLFSNLYNDAPVGYCTLSQRGRILNANQTLGDMLGVDQEKLLHRMLSEFVDRASQDAFYLHRQRSIESRQRQVSEVQLVKQNEERMLARIESVTDRGDPAQLMVMVSDITDQRRLENLQQQNALQLILQRRLIEQSEMERMELARNLHDGPIQRLAGFGFSIQILKEVLQDHGVNGDANIQQMRDDIKELIEELRGMCNDLRPPLLGILGLGEAIKENVGELQAKHPLTNIHLELDDEPTLLPEPIALALYRIYQQALNNIYKHAEASEVWIRLKLGASQILFEVQDNGRGFPTKVEWSDYLRQGHLGLVGMKERAEAVGGEMQVKSGFGNGTTIQVMFPLATSAAK